MKGTDRAILSLLLAVGLLAAFYLVVLSPKREEASKLSEEITVLESAISEQQQVAAFAEQARRDFPTYYGRVVVLGKAVPEQADSSSLLVQLNSIANGTGVNFRAIKLSDGGGAGAPPAATSTGASPAGTSGAETPPPGTTPSVTDVPAPATEVGAASLPIGATVGPAGLPTLPYELSFAGGFFDVADFIAGVDGLVKLRPESGQVAADGRLLTIDGFSLQSGGPGPSPVLGARFLMTSYVTPSTQGLTGGASPSGPAPAATAPTTTASTVTP
jgi:Tfp pilus assembly protein PilO